MRQDYFDTRDRFVVYGRSLWSCSAESPTTALTRHTAFAILL